MRTYCPTFAKQQNDNYSQRSSTITTSAKSKLSRSNLLLGIEQHFFDDFTSSIPPAFYEHTFFIIAIEKMQAQLRTNKAYNDVVSQPNFVVILDSIDKQSVAKGLFHSSAELQLGSTLPSSSFPLWRAVALPRSRSRRRKRSLLQLVSPLLLVQQQSQKYYYYHLPDVGQDM